MTDVQIRPREGGRAAPLPPEARRAAIVAAALPLVREHGADVTTKQIAEAAGVAEGTIFRVFPDKVAVIDAVVDTAFDNTPAVAAVRAIDPGLPAREKVALVCEIFRRRLADLWQLMAALRLFGPPASATRPPGAPDRRGSGSPELDAAVVDLLASSAAELRVDPVEAARVVRIVLFSATHPRITEGRPMATDDIVALLFDGLGARPTTPSAPGED